MDELFFYQELIIPTPAALNDAVSRDAIIKPRDKAIVTIYPSIPDNSKKACMNAGWEIFSDHSHSMVAGGLEEIS